MESKVKEDIKQRQRMCRYHEVLAEYAERYRVELHRGDLYMASNFFEEMFGTAVRLLNREDPGLPPREKLAKIRGLLHDALDNVGADDEFADAFNRDFELCTIKHAPWRVAKHARREEAGVKGG